MINNMEPYKIKMIERINFSSINERERWIKEAHYNLFNLKSNQVTIDLLTDSGANAMSDKQWSEMMLGDESYAGSESFYKLSEVATKLFGMQYILPVHQGRAAEHVIFTHFIKDNNIVPSNGHFDTTRGHITFRNGNAIDCLCEDFSSTNNTDCFGGNIDLTKLSNLLEKHSEKIPLVILTISLVVYQFQWKIYVIQQVYAESITLCFFLMPRDFLKMHIS